jgi:HD-GYP domain-containing protein (c-di-GMP phosphodiesterase class II)
MLVELSELQTEADLVHAHHERFDGTGYPRGLRGEEIPFGARIFAIVDAFDAMTSDRPYRAAWPPQAARDEIAKMAGTQFDPSLAGVFLEIPDKSLTRLGQAYPDAGP